MSKWVNRVLSLYRKIAAKLKSQNHGNAPFKYMQIELDWVKENALPLVNHACSCSGFFTQLLPELNWILWKGVIKLYTALTSPIIFYFHENHCSQLYFILAGYYSGGCREVWGNLRQIGRRVNHLPPVTLSSMKALKAQLLILSRTKFVWWAERSSMRVGSLNWKVRTYFLRLRRRWTVRKGPAWSGRFCEQSNSSNKLHSAADMSFCTLFLSFMSARENNKERLCIVLCLFHIVKQRFVVKWKVMPWPCREMSMNQFGIEVPSLILYYIHLDSRPYMKNTNNIDISLLNDIHIGHKKGKEE
jgi:hypothetical protein